jgi:hypothetical protein
MVKSEIVGEDYLVAYFCFLDRSLAGNGLTLKKLCYADNADQGW